MDSSPPTPPAFMVSGSPTPPAFSVFRLQSLSSAVQKSFSQGSPPVSKTKPPLNTRGGVIEETMLQVEEDRLLSFHGNTSDHSVEEELDRSHSDPGQ
ncbi:hypothetical protein TNCV_536361 [Trichonephila clavipes]|nr:hypothetical protein TNCV_536361 [Trichonephila clavipes]